VANGGVISVQVLNELASVSRRTLGLSWEDVGDALVALRMLCPSATPLTTDTHDAGLRIAAKYGFPFYDALIAAAALEAECTTLYSEDFQDGQVIEGRLTVRNPFV
jgi:predicted nucleic acid-binding protein